ncbi:MAG TPA: hypothetical protein VI461_16975 [Chitinophagaceae bacterium]|nr:hypothetical protein [Chitinophagaceae bacterium]
MFYKKYRTSNKIKIVYGTVGIILVLTMQYCIKISSKMENNLKDVKEIFQRDKDEIIAKYSATGAGIGKDGEQYIIVVYTNRQMESTKYKLYWKKIQLQIKYIGDLKLQ